jgi:hypothetical protein
MKTTHNDQDAKGGSDNGAALSTDIEWLRMRENGWQFGEAGVIQAITSKIDCNKVAIEYGGGESIKKTTIQRLIGHGWKCLLIEPDPDRHDVIKSEIVGKDNVILVNKKVDPSSESDSLASIMRDNGIEKPGVVVIDIDSADIVHMKAMFADGISPEVLCVEHHDSLDPNVDHSIEMIPSDEEFGKANKDGFRKQANSIAIAKAAWNQEYVRVWASRVNSIFVKQELYDAIESTPETTTEGQYDYDAYGCRRDWKKADNPKVSLILSQPRLCFTDHSDRLIGLASKLKFNVFRSSGAFWDRDIEHTTMAAINADQPDFLLYSDYDSVFDPDDVFKMLNVINNDPSIAVIGALQMSRHDDRPLVFEADKDYSTTTTKIDFHHFGLTLIRRQVFEELPHPWFWSTPGVFPDGRVGWDAPGRSDGDITFWRLLRNANMKVVQHNEVVIGHMILAVKWPKNTGYGVQLQPIENYNRHGKPANATINQDIYRKRMEEEAKKRQGMTNG